MNHVSVIEIDNSGRYIWLTGRQSKRINGKWHYLESYIVTIEIMSFSIEHINLSDVVFFQDIAFSKNNKKAYVGVGGYLDLSGNLNIVNVYSTETYAKLKSIVVGSEGSMPGKISRGRAGYLIVDNRISGELSKIDTLTDEVVLIKPGHQGEPSGWDGGSSLSAKCLFTSHHSPIIGVYDLNSLEPISDISLPYDDMQMGSLIVDPTGRYVILGTSYWKWDENNQWVRGKEILVLNAQTYETFRVLELVGEPVHNLLWLDIAGRH